MNSVVFFFEFEFKLEFKHIYFSSSSSTKTIEFSEFEFKFAALVERASAFTAVHLGLIPSRVKPMTLKVVFTASLLDAQGQCGEQAGKFTCCAFEKGT